jgi:hypothetical protein
MERLLVEMTATPRVVDPNELTDTAVRTTQLSGPSGGSDTGYRSE